VSDDVLEPAPPAGGAPDATAAPEAVTSFHALLTSLPDYEGQVAAYTFFPPRRGAVEEGYAGPYAPELRRLGVVPYGHQAAALRALGSGEDVVVATPTASGKSLVFQVPLAAAVSRGGTGVVLYPTKALAHDQLGRLRALYASLRGPGAPEPEAAIATYDGDTATERRATVREGVRVALTNPDMLHYGVLPYHERWAAFLGSLELVVLDELHAYRGVLGTHVANVVRRLLRLAARYGASPRVVCASATVGNPGEHAARLTGRSFTVVDADDAPAAAREFVVWKPPSTQDGRRRSANSEAARLAAAFAARGVKSIFFCNSRKAAELVRRYAAQQLPPELERRVGSYRAGYTAEDRRALEQAFRAGEVTVLTATSALELGMDVGGVDAVVMVGYPGSKMALWQRAGRAGRGGRRSLALLIPAADPLDEYYLTHPDRLVEGPVENAVADPHNRVVHPLHVACAAAEAPVREGEELLAPWLDLADVPGLHETPRGWVHRGRYPHRRVSLRGTGGRLIRLKDGAGKTLGVSDLGAALRELHPGAVYLHQGETYLVASLDLQRGIARLLPHIEDYYTQPRSETDIEVLRVVARGRGAVPAVGAEVGWLPPGVALGDVRVTHTVTSYVRKRYFSEAVIEERPLDLPETSYVTQAVWFDAEGLAEPPAAADMPSALHALEHTLIQLLPAFVLCERADVGGVSYPVYPATGGPLVFVYDGYPGGVGYAWAGAHAFADWLQAARDLLRACDCKDGCPRCVLSPKCGNGNQYLDKGAARVLADALLGRLGGASAALTA
jgi:DEAD/DEAH box helicase domain-containing protein